MSEFEDPAQTVARLLKTKMRVVKDGGALANINVSSEWQSSEAFKGYDGQVTVAVADCADEKVELTGNLRRRTSNLRVNVWTTETAGATESGKNLRSKILAEANRVIRQNRSKPNEATFDFCGQASGGQACRAFSGDFEDAPGSGWTELSDADYQKLWYNDDDCLQVSQSEGGSFAVLLLGFKLDCREAAVKKLVLEFEGYAMAPGGGGFAVKVWNHVAQAWQNAQSSEANSEDAAVSLTLQTNLSNFIDDDGYVWLLAKTSNPSDGHSPATLTCNYASCTTTVNGITYCDVSGYRNLDRADIKPPIYRTELSVKSWFFENIGV